MTREGWQPIETALRDGTRLRLANERDKSSMRIGGICPTFGEFDGKRWVLSSYFIVPGGTLGLMSSEPTHWMHLPAAPHNLVPAGAGE